MSILIRNAQVQDAPALVEILTSVEWFDHLRALPPEKLLETTHSMLSRCCADESHTLLVAQAEGSALLGYLSVHWLPYLLLPGVEGYISELFVHSAGRGAGVGRLLMESVKQAGRERGCVRLSLINSRERESYRRGFYRKHGWSEREAMANFVYRFDAEK